MKKNLGYFVLILSFLVFSCTEGGDQVLEEGTIASEQGTENIPLYQSNNKANSDDTAQDETANEEEWKNWVPDYTTVDKNLRSISIAAEWPNAIPVMDLNHDRGLISDPENASCIYQAYGRVATVEIEAIVRDYGHNSLGNEHWTVYRLRVKKMLKGSSLPETIYAAAITGCFHCGPDGKHGSMKYSNAHREVGMTGIAFLHPLGYDPIRSNHLLEVEEDANKRIIPARIVSFGLFLSEKEDGSFDSRENELLSTLTSGNVTLPCLIKSLADSDVACPTQPTLCEDCGTAETCLGYGSDNICGCINDWKGCKDLPKEDSERCLLHDTTM